MTREEEKEHQSHLYTKVRCDLVEIPDWEEVEFGFQAGMEYADEHPIHYDGQAMLHVLQKGVKQGKKEMLDKVCKWIERNGNYYIGFTQGQPCISDDFIEDLKKWMKE